MKIQPIRKSSSKTRWPIIWVMIAVVAVVTIIALLSRGRTVTSGTYPAPVSTDALSCESSSYIYPYFTSGEPTAVSTKVNIALGQAEIESISIMVASEYASEEETISARDMNRAAMNTAFGKAGFDADALGAVYSKKGNTFNFSLYANGADLSSAAYPFFSLGDNPEASLEKLNRNYTALGFKCLANH